MHQEENWLGEDQGHTGESGEVQWKIDPEVVRRHEKETRRIQPLLAIHRPIISVLNYIHLDAPRRVEDANRKAFEEEDGDEDRVTYEEVAKFLKYAGLTQLPEGENIHAELKEILFSPAVLLHSYLLIHPSVTPVLEGFAKEDRLINAVLASELFYDGSIRKYEAAIDKEPEEEQGYQVLTDDILQDWEYDTVRNLNDKEPGIEARFVQANTRFNHGLGFLRRSLSGEGTIEERVKDYEKSVKLRAEIFRKVSQIGAVCAQADAVERKAISRYGFRIGKAKWRLRDDGEGLNIPFLLGAETGDHLGRRVREDLKSAQKEILGVKPRKFQDSEFKEALTVHVLAYLHNRLLRD